MFILLRLPGRDTGLSHSIQALILALAEAWALEFRRGNRPPSLYQSGIIYQAEPYDWPAEEWADPMLVASRGWGDCDDLVIYRLAEILADSNYDPKQGQRSGLPAWPMVYRKMDGSQRYHIGIRHADGSEEDPARRLSKDGKVS